MKMKKIIKKMIVVLLMLLIIGIIINNNVFAWDMQKYLGNYENDATAGRAGDTVTNIVGGVIHLSTTVSAGVAIIMLIVIGVKYTSTSAEGKADAKKDLTGYIIGAVILFGISGILRILQMFIDGNLNNI